MKLWAILAVCILLLSSVSSIPLPSNWLAGKKRSHLPDPQEGEDQVFGMDGAVPEDPTANMAPQDQQTYTEIPDDYPDQFDDVLEFIQDTIKRLKRSSNKQPPSRRDRGRQSLAANTQISSKKTVKDRKRKNKGCVLREIHLNVTDLGLGYETKEELKFRYCSGSCNNPETTYDQILKNLTIRKKLVNDKVKQACCRPIAFDDDLSFLDDNLVYHTLKQHSAKKCGCI
ncbi:glial cell line-derived neurotrophic factor precursor [Xenopus laevis]|uniref:Glial cell line-derived neurotrophic factor n=1 Tax=Xenopus laevis TaxID=8355 RepID=GDNF_XENLA|nr:glial cell line-derived neurotrophic factor precursor [Xenopus laevis]Q06PM8.1 RecName: Full=Glial cell line-derived neurotrophic factor; Short=xGDNF; Flags: Precursor [Xenopus laevis]ABG77975.1 glial cell line-derived neurotrophic factor [Xenopus laevis]